MTTKISTTNIQDSALTTLLGPKVTTIVYPGTETATDTAGGETINLTGNGFQSGCNVLVGSTSASVVTFISSTQISFTAPAMTANTYVLYVINPDGGTAISIPGISYSGTPNWTTSAGSLGTAYEAGSISATLTATGDAPITYVLASGTLPTGSTLSSSGSLSGTAPATASATTYNFTITAKDAQNQTTNRAFSLTINPDVVTWSTPASSTTYNVFTNSAIANVAMSATSAAGGSITYTADTLPTGLSITGANIAGTPTVVASTTTTLTATATSTRSATRTINWVVSIANDTYFKNTTLLLNGETTVTPFISDASTNSFGLTINGDTKPVLFNPYQGDGYYGAYFGGSAALSTTGSNLVLGTGDFTIEMWVYIPANTGTYQAFYNSRNNGVGLFFGLDNGGMHLMMYYGGITTTDANTLTLNQWNHVALVRYSGTTKIYKNGVAVGTPYTDGNNYTSTVTEIGRDLSFSYDTVGWISNVRIVKGTAVYTTTFTPSTTPLTAITNTGLLTCQSSRFIDKSTNAYTLTLNGTPQISPNIPFTQNSSYSTYGSAYFDGTGDYLLAASNAAFGYGSGDFTIEMWYYSTGTTGDTRYLFNQRPADGAALAPCILLNAGVICVFLNGSYAITGPTITVNTWNHLALVRASGTTKLYINGTQSGSSYADSNVYITSPMYIGTTVAGYSWLGYIADFRVVKGTAVYTTAFTPPTVPLTAIANTSLLTLQYNGGANNSGIIDNSNFNNIITRNGNTSQGTFSPYIVTGWSNYFDGSGDYLTLTGSSIGSSNYTVEAWIWPTSLTAFSIFSLGTSDTTGNMIFHVASDGSINLYADNTSRLLSSAGLIKANQWQHVALVRNGTTSTIYVNGVSAASSTNTYTSTSTAYQICAGYGGLNTPITGYISNLRVVNGTAVYTSAFTPPTTPLTAIANTSLLTCQSNRFIDNSTNNFTLTRTGDVSVQAFSPFAPAASYTPSLHGGSAYFDGTGDYLTVNNGLHFGTRDFTIEFWLNPNVQYEDGSAIPIFSGETSGSGLTWGLFFASYAGYNGLTFSYGRYGYYTVGKYVNGYWGTKGVWSHIVFQRRSGVIQCYINGVSQTLNTYNENETFSDSVNFNGNNTTKDIGSSYTGYLSDMRVLDGTGLYPGNFIPSTAPLTAVANTSLLINFTNAGIIDQSGKNNLETLGNAQLSTAVKKYNNASMYFDGASGLFSGVNIAVGTGDFTYETWVYPTVSSHLYPVVVLTASSLLHLFGLADAAAGSLSSLKTIFGASTRPGSSNSWFTAPAISQNVWTHLAFVRSGTTISIYVNGVSQTITTTNQTNTNRSETTNVSYIGRSASGEYLTGYLDDLRITKGVARYTSNFTAPTEALITK